MSDAGVGADSGSSPRNSVAHNIIICGGNISASSGPNLGCDNGSGNSIVDTLSVVGQRKVVDHTFGSFDDLRIWRFFDLLQARRRIRCTPVRAFDVRFGSLFEKTVIGEN
jgi:hypothetical protein